MTRTTADIARSSGSRGVPRARASPGVPSYSSRRSRFVTNSFPLSLHRSTPRLVVQRIINRWFYTKSTVVYTVSKPTNPGNVRSQSWREGDGPPRLSESRRVLGETRWAHLLIQLEPLAFLLRQLLVAAGEGELLASEALLPLGLLSCRRRWGGVGRGQWIARRGKKSYNLFSAGRDDRGNGRVRETSGCSPWPPCAPPSSPVSPSPGPPRSRSGSAASSRASAPFPC